MNITNLSFMQNGSFFSDGNNHNIPSVGVETLMATCNPVKLLQGTNDVLLHVTFRIQASTGGADIFNFRLRRGVGTVGTVVGFNYIITSPLPALDSTMMCLTAVDQGLTVTTVTPQQYSFTARNQGGTDPAAVISLIQMTCLSMKSMGQ